MSSFLHSAKHFNSIEKSLIDLKKNNSAHGFCYNVSKIDIEQVMKHYRKFSCICVTNQYAHHHDDINAELASCFQSLTSDQSYVILKPIELYKAITSMEYQIEFNHLGREFDDSEKLAVLKFNEIKMSLCDLIINKLPEYDNCRGWSI